MLYHLQRLQHRSQTQTAESALPRMRPILDHVGHHLGFIEVFYFGRSHKMALVGLHIMSVRLVTTVHSCTSLSREFLHMFRRSRVGLKRSSKVSYFFKEHISSYSSLLPSLFVTSANRSLRSTSSHGPITKSSYATPGPQLTYRPHTPHRLLIQGIDRIFFPRSFPSVYCPSRPHFLRRFVLTTLS